jgi:lysophospholipase L1-like esterase
LEEGHEKSERLMGINELLRSVKTPSYILIDTFEEIAGNNDALPSSYTTDGVHLPEEGYNSWVSVLKPFLNQNK